MRVIGTVGSWRGRAWVPARRERLGQAGLWSAFGALVVVVVFASVQLGLATPHQEELQPFADVRTLEPGRFERGAFSPLRQDYIDRLLGLSGAALATGAVGGVAAARTPMPPSLPGGAPRSPSSGAPRTVVAHEANNDDIHDAYVVTAVPFTASTRTTQATRQPDEPGGCSPTGGGTIWYRYQPPSSGVLVATTFGSDHSTALAVFTPGRGSDLHEVGCDFDVIGAAQVVFSATAGQSYLFQVAGSTGGGRLVFNLDPLGATRRVSVSSSGAEGNEESAGGALSADGRYLTFTSKASNLVAGDTNSCPPDYGGTAAARPDTNGPGWCPDIFVRDTLTGRTERVSVSSDGAQANNASGYGAISGDGRHVAFASLASNLVAGDTNDQWDVFVHDRVTQVTERVSVDSEERQGRFSRDVRANDPNLVKPSVSLSHDGRYVAFASDFPNLVRGDHNACVDSGIVDVWGTVDHPEPPLRAPVEAVAYNCRDVFVRDRAAGTTTRVSVSSAGAEGQGDSASANISPDGRYVAFTSDAENLDHRDRNQYRDAFVHDRATGTTQLVSLSSSGEQGNANSGGINERGDTSISADGRYVAFISHASNFSAGDGPDQDVFLRDRVTGTTAQLPGTFDEDPESDSAVFMRGLHAAISSDGRFVASSTVVVVVRAGQTRTVSPILVYDRLADRTTRVSVSSAGSEANDLSGVPEISADGRVVAFTSDATNLVDDDRNGKRDVFLHELPWARWDR